jgi:hypothetical protein
MLEYEVPGWFGTEIDDLESITKELGQSNNPSCVTPSFSGQGKPYSFHTMGISYNFVTLAS